MKLIVLRAGDPVPSVAERRGRFFDWIQRAGNVDAEWLEHDVRTDAPLPGPRDADAFIMTGSSSSVTDRAHTPWMLRSEELLRAIVAAETPFLGICFGHQMLGQALGGLVAKNPNGREIGTLEVKLADGAEDEPILAGLPKVLLTNNTHVDSVVRLPLGARVLGSSALEPNAIFTLGETTKCVQFHPEFDGDVMRGYIEARADRIEEEGLDIARIRAAATDTPASASIVQNFVHRVVRR